MINRLHAFAFLALVALGAGCAPDLTLSNARALRLGETTGAELTQKFGKPDESARKTADGKDVEVCSYIHSGVTTVVMVRIMDHRFLRTEIENDRLHGYFFAGTQGENKTTYDQEVFKRITKGMTRAQVQSLLGPPHGEGRGPTQIPEFKDCFPEGARDVWVYCALDGATAAMWSDTTARMMVVGFDASDVVVGTSTQQLTRGALGR